MKVTDIVYRPDIDGLRAIAVLAVVAFHAAPNRVSGGFIGVDIFFVISGYLIARIIFKSLKEKNFSFINFYTSRIKRIFPPLIFVIFTVSIFSWFLLIPEENALTGKHVAASSVFAWNLLLWNESGYFDIDAKTKPLLHLWSLGIEMQFYLIAPVLFLLVYRFKSKVIYLLGLIFIASYGLNLSLIQYNPTASFYFLLSRIFEFLAGSILAVYSLNKNQDSILKNIYFKEIAWFSGLCMVITSIFLINYKNQFPGYVVLVPVIGSILLIYSGSESMLSRYFLMRSVMVLVGKVSYPLYLWHWPLLSFANIIYGGAPPYSVRGALVLISVFLAFLTYYFIELPFKRNKIDHKVIILCLILGLVSSFGYLTYFLKGMSAYPLPVAYKKAFDGEYSTNDQFFKELNRYLIDCQDDSFLYKINDPKKHKGCYQSRAGDPIDTVIVGDSHAQHLFPGLVSKMLDRNIGLFVSAHAPLLVNPGFEKFFNQIKYDNNIRTVLIASYWIASMKEFVPKESSFGQELAKAAALITESGKMVYLIVDNHSFSFPPEYCRYSRFPGINSKCSEDVSVYVKQTSMYLNELKKIELSNPKIKVIDQSGLICDERVCTMIHNEKMLYRDYNHLSISGSNFVGAYIASMVD